MLHLKVSTRLLLCFVSLLLLAQQVLAATDSYTLTQAGYGGGGRFTSIAIAEDSPELVYVGSDVAGFFVSEDSAQTFVPRGKDLAGLAVADMAVPPGEPDHIVLLCDKGLYYSTDRGDNLQLLSNKIRYEHRFFGSNLILFGEGNVFYVASDIEGVFQFSPSSDSPGQWDSTMLLGLGGYKVNSLALFNDNLFAATDDGVYHWDDEYWAEVSNGLSFGSNSVVDMTATEKLYIAEKHTGVYVWQTNNESWKSLGPKPSILPGKAPVLFKTLCQPSSQPGTLFLATHPEYWPNILVRTTDMGQQWKLITQFARSSGTINWDKGMQAVESLEFTKDKTLGVLADWWNVWRSKDEGLSWVQVHDGLQNTVINDIQLQPGNPDHIFLAVSDNGVMVSKDAGKSWQRSMLGVEDGHSRALGFSKKSPDKLYMALEPWNQEPQLDSAKFHVYKSLDAGQTWTHYPFTVPRKTFSLGYVDSLVSNLVVSPSNDDTIFLAINGYGIFQINTSLSPENAANTVVNVAANLTKPYIKGPGALIVHPDNPQILYAGVQNGGVYKTTDGGNSWNLSYQTEGFIFGMAMDPNNTNRLLAAASDTVFLTSDGGDTWNRLQVPFPTTPGMSINAVDFGADGRIYIGILGFDGNAGRGVFVSNDNGTSFKHVPSNAAAVGVNVIRNIPGKPGQAYVGYNGLGLYKIIPKP